MASAPTVKYFEIQGRRFAAECWGEASGGPVFALHGWLDNCHSFRPIAPLLEKVQLVALDMAGHGHSDHRSPDASYHIWDDVREILLLADELGWSTFSILGHSRGAIIGAMLAAVAPERVKRLVLIDGLLPLTTPAEEAASQLKKFLDAYLAWPGIWEGRKDLGVMIRGRMRAGFGLAETPARMLVERNTEYVDGYYYWRSDPRLQMPSPQMLSDEAAWSFVSRIAVPTLLLLASEGWGRVAADLPGRLADHGYINVMIIPGGHHLHMEEAGKTVAEAFNRFMMSGKI